MLINFKLREKNNKIRKSKSKVGLKKENNLNNSMYLGNLSKRRKMIMSKMKMRKNKKVKLD